MSKISDKQKHEHLFDMASVLGQQTDFEEILRVVSHKIADFFNAKIVLILMINPRTQQTVKTIYKEVAPGSVSRYKRIQNQVSGWILMNKKPLICTDIKKDSRFKHVKLDDISVRSVIGVPIQIEKSTIGTLILIDKKNKDLFTEEDLTYLEKVALISAPFLRNVQQLQHYFEKPLPEAALRGKYEKFGLVGKSQKFVELLRAIEAAASTDVRILLEGQSGTGKELIARAIHQLSQRCEEPFVAIDCGAIPENLIESELFGHKKGAFTGATREKIGLVEAANQGTLFMDEISNLPFEMQSKFLRMAEENRVRPVGSTSSRKVDVRIISASSQSLRKMVDNNIFRQDLFYRLYVYPISVPSLRDRREDIPMLANHFLHKFANQQNKTIRSFHESMLTFMYCRRWDGNIRELQNFIERLVTITPRGTDSIDISILPEEFRKEFKNFALPERNRLNKSLAEILIEAERNAILTALQSANWNQSKAARMLNISESTIRYKMKKSGIKNIS